MVTVCGYLKKEGEGELRSNDSSGSVSQKITHCCNKFTGAIWLLN